MSIAELLGGFIMVNISRRNVLISTAFAGMTGLSGTASAAAAPCSAAMPKKWNYEADVVIIGAGAVGLPAAIGARDAGLSVLVVDANYDIGGHAITSGGNVPLGGGTSFQKKYGIKDSPELVFKDLTDWSIVESGGMPDYRYNDRAVQHALAFNMAPAFEFLLANGVPFVDQAPDNSGAHAVGLGASTIRFGSKVSPQKALPAPAEHSLCAVLRLRQERREFSFCSTITWMNSTERLRGTAEWLD